MPDVTNSRLSALEQRAAKEDGRLDELSRAQQSLLDSQTRCTRNWDRLWQLMHGHGSDRPGLLWSFATLRTEFAAMKGILRWGVGLLTVVTAAVIIDIILHRGGG